MSMKLSFVIPAYNEEAYLGACIESILIQVGQDATGDLQRSTEIIVVNMRAPIAHARWR